MKFQSMYYNFKLNWPTRYKPVVKSFISLILNLAVILSFFLIGQFLDSEVHLSDLVNIPSSKL